MKRIFYMLSRLFHGVSTIAQLRRDAARVAYEANRLSVYNNKRALAARARAAALEAEMLEAEALTQHLQAAED